MEQLTKTIVLGIIQGLTEWLPISSTGHLRLAERFLGLEVPILFDVILHVGTLIVVLVFFRRGVGKMLAAIAHLDFKTDYGKMVPLIIVGVIPTFLIGLVFGSVIQDAFRSVSPIAVAFIICGLIIYPTKFGKEKTESINYSKAIMIGIAQGIAIIPGISRSGATIAVALFLGIKREKAFEFSFLVSIPAILGALGLTIYTEFAALASGSLDWGEIVAGTIIAMLVGYFALKMLWKILANRRFNLFAFYCWLLAAVLIALSLSGF